MKKNIKPSLKSKIKDDKEYQEIVADLINDPIVYSMSKFIQHNDISCYLHCINVSYHSYLVCKSLGLNYKEAARGGLLHDLFLYDWHITKLEKGMHGFTHPYKALENSNKYFKLNDIEKDVIVKHMWPLTLKFPRFKEAFIVCFVDKYCALMETINITNKKKLEILVGKSLIFNEYK
ncbi:MAG: HD family phosphohydrolase [Clostridiaceae bacterium]